MPTIDELMEAMEAVMGDKAVYDKAREAGDGNWLGFAESLDESKERYAKALTAYIDERIKESKT